MFPLNYFILIRTVETEKFAKPICNRAKPQTVIYPTRKLTGKVVHRMQNHFIWMKPQHFHFNSIWKSNVAIESLWTKMYESQNHRGKV